LIELVPGWFISKTVKYQMYLTELNQKLGIDHYQYIA